jgi:hypothetical protein
LTPLKYTKKEMGQKVGYNCLFSDRSDNKIRIKVAITGRRRPKKNQSNGLRPSLLAKRDVMMGILNKNKTPMLRKRTAPMCFRIV